MRALAPRKSRSIRQLSSDNVTVKSLLEIDVDEVVSGMIVFDRYHYDP